MLSNDSLYRSTLEDLIKLQPNNQTILSEYFSFQHEPIPRKLRRLRVNPTETNSNSSSQIKPNPQSTVTIEEPTLTYEQLEEIRSKKTPPFSENTRYQFTQQLDTLKSSNLQSACSLILRLPSKGLFKIVSAASPKLIETVVNVGQLMINAEKRYQQEHKSAVLPFSYIKFAFNILIELTTLPRLDSTLSMIDFNCRMKLDDLLTYFSSISMILNDVDKLERLRK